MHLIKFYKVLLTAVIFVCGCVGQQVTQYELENGPGTGWPMGRNGASERTSRSMRSGGWIEFKVCLSEPAGITISDVFYSNDGPADYMGIYVNNTNIGTFNSKETKGGTGRFWDVFKPSGQVGSEIYLRQGEHIFKIEVEAADYYGVELDKIVIQTDRNIDEYNFWCGLNPQVIPSPEKAPTSTSSSSTVTSEATTSVVTTTEAETTSKGETTTPSVKETIFVEQLSFKSKCLDKPNVRVKFHPTSLKGVDIISKAAAIANKDKRSNLGGQGKDLRTCKSTMWQIGVANGQPAGTGPVSQAATVNYDVNAKGENEPDFPSAINPTQTDNLLLRYVKPADISLQDSVLYFTIGLAEIDKDVKIGVQYYDAKKKGFSNTQFITFKPNQRVVGWELPASAVSSSEENKILVIFDTTATTPIKFDFLRLDHTPEDAQQKNNFLVRQRGFSIKGSQYKPLENQPMPKGMNVSIDAGKETEHFAKLTITNKRRLRNAGPVWNSLTISDKGRLYPLHENRNSLKLSRDAEGKTFKDVSGIILGDPNNPITNVRIVRMRSEIVITFADSTYVRLIYRPGNSQTRLSIVDSTLKNNTVEFESTHVTDYMAAVNDVSVDNKITKPVMDNLDNVKGKQFVFVKTSPNPMYHASTYNALIFPENVIPK